MKDAGDAGPVPLFRTPKASSRSPVQCGVEDPGSQCMSENLILPEDRNTASCQSNQKKLV